MNIIFDRGVKLKLFNINYDTSFPKLTIPKLLLSVKYRKYSSKPIVIVGPVYQGYNVVMVNFYRLSFDLWVSRR